MKKPSVRKPSPARSHRIRKLLELKNKPISRKALAWATIGGLFVLIAIGLWLGDALLNLLR